MPDRPLTEGQLEVLTEAARPGGIKKGEISGGRWRNLDQLEVRGLVAQRFGRERYGAYRATQAGERRLAALRDDAGKPPDEAEEPGTGFQP